MMGICIASDWARVPQRGASNKIVQGKQALYCKFYIVQQSRAKYCSTLQEIMSPNRCLGNRVLKRLETGTSIPGFSNPLASCPACEWQLSNVRVQVGDSGETFARFWLVAGLAAGSWLVWLLGRRRLAFLFVRIRGLLLGSMRL